VATVRPANETSTLGSAKPACPPRQRCQRSPRRGATSAPANGRLVTALAEPPLYGALADPLVRTQAAAIPALAASRTARRSGSAAHSSAPTIVADTLADPSAAVTVEPATGTTTSAPSPTTRVAIHRACRPRSAPAPPGWRGTTTAAPTTKRGPGEAGSVETGGSGAAAGTGARSGGSRRGGPSQRGGGSRSGWKKARSCSEARTVWV